MTAVALAAGVLATGCTAAAIGGGVLVAGVVAGILTYDCAEGVGVTLWDRATAHPVCDATVLAEQDGKSVAFSPCYNTFLGEGTWTVSATKDGYQRAQGTVIIPHGHSCSQPTYHSVELTLLRHDEGANGTQLGPPSPAPTTPPPVMEPPPGAPPQVGQPTPGAPASGTATPPEAAPPPIMGAPPGPAAPSPITGRPPPVAPAPPPSPSPAPSGQAVPPSAAFPLPGKAK